ncbi:MAG: RraA family protein [Runella sp.]
MLTHADLLKLKRWNTPTIYNGWEQITSHDTTKGHFNLEDTRDYMPQMGPMVGYAVTVVCEPSNPKHLREHPENLHAYREYLASVPGPKIVVVQDLDSPHIGSFWGEVNANVHHALGCVGTITHGAIRDLDEMTNAGFKALAKRMCVGHAFSWPVRWGVEVEVFGCPVKPGDLIHADKHGFLVVPPEDQARLYEAASFMDANECNTVIAAARNTTGKPMQEVLEAFRQAGKAFGQAALDKFGRKGEW